MTAQLSVVPSPTTPRGFVIHVDLGPEEFAAALEDVMVTADTLRELVHEWLPKARTRTALTSTAPGEPSGGAARPTARSAAREPAPGSAATLRARLAAMPDVPAVHVDLAAGEVTVAGRPLDLTDKEFELFAHLVLAEGRVVSRAELLGTVWRGRSLPPGSRTVDVHVRRLRTVPELAALVTTVHGSGYRVAPRPHLTVTGR